MIALSHGHGDFCTVCISRNEIHLQIFIPGAVSLAFYCWNNGFCLIKSILKNLNLKIWWCVSYLAASRALCLPARNIDYIEFLL